MASSFSQLSASFARLSSLERRFIILVLVIIFIVINLIFVLPHFGDLGRIDNRFGEANSKQEKFQKEISQIAFYTKEIEKLGGDASSVPPEDQSVSIRSVVNTQAAQSGVTIGGNSSQPTRTNQFFVELGLGLTTQSGEAQLVDFLYNLGEGSSLIRARSLSVRPDQSRTSLNATMTLVASFQKKPTARSATPAAKSSTPPTKSPTPAPTTTPAPKPATSTAPAAKTNKPAGSLPVTKTLAPPNK